MAAIYAPPLTVPRMDPTATAAIARAEGTPKRRRAHTARASYEARRQPIRRGARQRLEVSLAELIRAKYLPA
jgi:hypothetical protein